MTDRKDTPDMIAARKAADPAPDVGPDAVASAGFGRRLGVARVARGLSLADCGRELHLPVKVLQRLEADDFGAPDDFVFLRGALRGYAAFLGLPPGSCDDVLRAVAPARQPALVSVARTSRPRWLLHRYGTAATYIVLTATIAVPLVVLGLRGGLQRPVARVVSLDQPAVSTPAVSVPSPPQHRVAIAPPPDLAPFRASMTPFAAIGLGEESQPEPAADTTQTAAPAAPAIPGQHTLTITASADCWFEITDADGNKIASGMLHAGDTRTWHATGLLHVTLGNAGAVTVTRDGQSFPLNDVQRANVAHFDVFGSAGAGENG